VCICLGNGSARRGFTDYADGLQGEPEQLEGMFLERCGSGDNIEATVLGVKSSGGRGPRCPQGPPALGTREVSRRWTCGQRGFAEFKRFPGMTPSMEYRF
jgi:hypothetical protein